jgi:hypothetical protein
VGQLTKEGLVGAQAEVIDAETAELGLPAGGIDLPTPTETDEPASGLGFDAADQAGTTQTLLRRIFEMQDDAVMSLGQHLKRRDGVMVMQVAQDDDRRPLDQGRSELTGTHGERGLLGEVMLS